MYNSDKIPEQELWGEVIKLAMKDVGFHYDQNGGVTYIPPVLPKTKRHQKDKASIQRINVSQGINFLTDNSGAWKESREFVCDMAMVCPDQLRERCIKIIGKHSAIQELIDAGGAA